jgi:hypothetical protein
MIGSMEHDCHEEGIGLMEHDYYEQEDRIIWLANRESLAIMGYVRERFQFAAIRTGPVRPPRGEELIGYAVLKQRQQPKSLEKALKEGSSPCSPSFVTMIHRAFSKILYPLRQ